MKQKLNEVEINGIKYVPKNSINKMAEKSDGLEYKIIRTYSAGVFAGYVKERNGGEATIVNARRLWYWSGAASLSELAMYGVKNPNNCKFAVPVDKIELINIIEILSVTQEAKNNIESVFQWRA